MEKTMSDNPNNNQGRSNDGNEPEPINEAGKPGSNYNIGYGRPPDKYKYKPGQSGNPLGRPKRPKPLSFELDLADELSQSIADTENRTITNKQAIVKAVVAAARKNPKQGMALMEYCAKVGHHEVDVGAVDDDAFIEKLATDISSSAGHQSRETENDQ
jgi:hypothetical protein